MVVCFGSSSSLVLSDSCPLQASAPLVNCPGISRLSYFAERIPGCQDSQQMSLTVFYWLIPEPILVDEAHDVSHSWNYLL